MKPPPAHHEEFDDSDLDAVFARVRQPAQADAGAAERFLSRQRLTFPEAAAPAQVLPRRRLNGRWPALQPALWRTLLAAALFGGVLVVRPAPTSTSQTTQPQPLLASSAAYDAYTSALGSEW